MNNLNIRPGCFATAENWIQPTPDEIQSLLAKISENLSSTEVADKLGLGKGGARTMRRWLKDDSPIPYAIWCILAYEAGMGKIWGNFSG